MNEMRYTKADTHNLVATVAYMIGVRKELVEINYGDDCHDLLQALYSSKSATIIRYLCKLRTTLFRRYKKTDDEKRDKEGCRHAEETNSPFRPGEASVVFDEFQDTGAGHDRDSEDECEFCGSRS